MAAETTRKRPRAEPTGMRGEQETCIAQQRARANKYRDRIRDICKWSPGTETAMPELRAAAWALREEGEIDFPERQGPHGHFLNQIEGNALSRSRENLCRTLREELKDPEIEVHSAKEAEIRRRLVENLGQQDVPPFAYDFIEQSIMRGPLRTSIYGTTAPLRAWKDYAAKMDPAMDPLRGPSRKPGTRGRLYYTPQEKEAMAAFDTSEERFPTWIRNPDLELALAHYYRDATGVEDYKDLGDESDTEALAPAARPVVAPSAALLPGTTSATREDLLLALTDGKSAPSYWLMIIDPDSRPPILDAVMDLPSGFSVDRIEFWPQGQDGSELAVSSGRGGPRYAVRVDNDMAVAIVQNIEPLEIRVTG